MTERNIMKEEDEQEKYMLMKYEEREEETISMSASRTSS
jgi:hypothetical protein